MAMKTIVANSPSSARLGMSNPPVGCVRPALLPTRCEPHAEDVSGPSGSLACTQARDVGGIGRQRGGPQRVDDAGLGARWKLRPLAAVAVAPTARLVLAVAPAGGRVHQDHDVLGR